MTRILVLSLLAFGAACDRDATIASSRDAVQTTATTPAGLERVPDTSQVCMVNDRFMGVPQIPVVVDGRTYFGCCTACKDKLARDTAARTTRDPVTGEPVDKATALIVRDDTGHVLYFAGEHTLRRYRG